MLDILFEKNTLSMLKSVNGTHKTHLMQQILFGIAVGAMFFGIGYFMVEDGNLGMISIAMGIAGAIAGEKYIYIQLINEVKNRKKIRKEMFPDFLKYFNSTLVSNNNNVVNTLDMTTQYLDEPLKSEVELLVSKVEDSEGREAFMDFARFIGTGEAVMIMGMLNDFHTHGVDADKVRDMERTVDKMAENILNEKIIRKSNSIEKYANPVILMVVAYVFFFVGILFIEMLSQLNF